MSEPARRPSSPWLVRWWLGLLAAAMAVAGIVTLIAHTAHEAASFGWFAYQPLSSVSYWIAFTPPTLPALLGAALLIAGLLLLVGVIGFRLGRRG